MFLESLLLAILAFIFGYSLGRRLGRASGVAEGTAMVPLLLRQKSHEQGYCALCHAVPEEKIRSPV